MVGWGSSQQLQQWLAQQASFRALSSHASVVWSPALGVFLVLSGVILGLVSTRLALPTTSQR